VSLALITPLSHFRKNLIGTSSIISLRQTELDNIQAGRRLTVENSVISSELSSAVETLVAASQGAIVTATARTQRVKRLGRTGLLSIVALSLISSAAIVWIYVGGVVARLTQLAEGMRAIVKGRRDIKIPMTGSDEITGMARAVEVFRENAVALDQLLEERAQAATRLEKTVEERTAELKRRGTELRVTFDNMAHAVVMFDSDLRLTAWNRQFATLLELPDSFLDSKPRFAEYIRYLAERGEYGAVDVESQVRQLTASVTEHFTFERTRPDGTVLEIRHNPLPGGGTVIIYTDITERSHYEHTLAAARDQAEAANRTKSSFLANMSHELRTPLNAILGYTELMADGAYGEPAEEMLGVLKRLEANGKHLLGLISDVLDLSKIEAGQLDLDLSDYSMQDITQTVCSTLEPLATDKKLAFKVEVPAELPPGRGDSRRLTQVLINLVGNAIKFTDAGEVAIKAEANNGSFQVAVRDTVPGISAADQAKLFQEFQQADNAITKKKGGTGLGLAISKRIIEMHGGRIWVESRPGQGSTFAFTLPVTIERQVMTA
jgi:signal transduction histidine kinase/HAMP domain-containing protein